MITWDQLTTDQKRVLEMAAGSLLQRVHFFTTTVEAEQLVDLGLFRRMSFYEMVEQRIERGHMFVLTGQGSSVYVNRDHIDDWQARVEKAESERDALKVKLEQTNQRAAKLEYIVRDLTERVEAAEGRAANLEAMLEIANEQLAKLLREEGESAE